MSPSCPLLVQVADDSPTIGEQAMVRLVATRGGEHVASVRYWTPANAALPMMADGRTALLTFLPLAMRLGTDIETSGAVDPLTLSQLDQWQKIMVRWHPERLRSVQLKAHRVEVPSQREQPLQMRALMGFSGGVDSCHTLWRHSARHGQSPLTVQTGLLVQGMDIPLESRQGFEGAARRAETMLQSHDATLQTVATDIRALEREFKLNWETHTHGIVLAACLSLFEKSFGAVLIASTYPAYDLQFPWASNPVTDPLLGGWVPYLHDGTDCNKLAKVLEFAEDTNLTDHLRVCWQGERKDANCGQCFKCVTTQACLWLAGVPSPRAFDRPALVSDLESLPIKNAVNHRLVEDIRSMAVQLNRTDIAQALNTALSRSHRGRHSGLGRWLTRLGVSSK